MNPPINTHAAGFRPGATVRRASVFDAAFAVERARGESFDMRLARWAMLAALFTTPAAAADSVSCFNDSGPEGRIGLWTYEGQTDWRVARQARGATFVLGFAPGRDEYQVPDLGYCFFINPNAAGAVKCTSGSLKVSRLAARQAMSGQYRFVLEDGQVKGLTFVASFCPPKKPAARE